MIKWILFDQAKVQVYNIFSQKNKYSINGKKFDAKTLEKIFHMPEHHKFNQGNINEIELISRFLEKEKLNLTVDEFRILLKKSIKPIKGVEKILKKLQQNYKLGTLINEGKEWAHYKLNISGLKKYFSVNIISGEVKMCKPNRNIFEKALEIINAKAHECVFIDDKEENCKAAQNIGMKSVIFKDTKQLKKELSKISIIV